MSALCMNRSHYNVPVYGTFDGAVNGYGKVGTIMEWELFTLIGGEGIQRIWFYSPSGWRDGYVKGDTYDRLFSLAFEPSYYGLMFKIRRQCRVFNHTTVIAYLYPGDYVLPSINSVGGEQYPYRLKIDSYYKSGNHYSGTDLWCDTDIEIGYSMYMMLD